MSYVYWEEEPGRRSAAKLLTRDEAMAAGGLTARPPASVTDDADMPLPDPKIGRGLSAAIALNLVLDGLSLVERTQAPNERRNVCFQE